MPTHTQTHTHVHTHTHTHTRVRMHAHTHAHTHARAHTYARARAHTHTHTHTHLLHKHSDKKGEQESDAEVYMKTHRHLYTNENTPPSLHKRKHTTIFTQLWTKTHRHLYTNENTPSSLHKRKHTIIFALSCISVIIQSSFKLRGPTDVVSLGKFSLKKKKPKKILGDLLVLKRAFSTTKGKTTTGIMQWVDSNHILCIPNLKKEKKEDEHGHSWFCDCQA